MRRFGIIGLLLFALTTLSGGCSQQTSTAVMPQGVPTIRVRLMQDRREIRVAATEPVWCRSAAQQTPDRVPFPRAGSILKLTAGKWYAGTYPLGEGALTLTPSKPGTLFLDGGQFRGRYRLVPTSANTFDVINDVDVDGYLKSVLSKELYPGWDDETYRAQAIAARTYAIYESRAIGPTRYWDVYPDQRSQMYGGVAAESSKSVRAVDATAGVVVAHGSPGQERIFKAYFSSCCGGITQSAYDAFGDPYSQPLSESNRGTTCNVSGARYSWDPVTISKAELSRRFAAWAKRKSEIQGQPRPELQMQGVARIDQAFLNNKGRPVYYHVTDNRGARFLMRAEDVRFAICTEPNGGKIVYSGFFTPVNGADSIQFTNGRGFGHGVGLCQWCAQSLARSGWRHEDIVVSAYPGSKLVRAY